MSTKDKKVNIYLKKFLPQQQITENFLDYLHGLITESFTKVWNDDGLFEPIINVTPLYTFPANDTFKLTTPLVGADGLGHLLNLDDLISTVQFENANTIDYHVGLRYNEILSGTEINVRTGEIKYTFFEEAIGELAEPDSVADDGDETLTIIVDSVTESGVSNAGRTVRVWLKNAVGQADAFEDCTVIWDGSNNKIETTTALNQTIGNISVDASDYQVFLIGPTVKRNTDLSLDPNILYLGFVTGSGSGTTPSVFDVTNVNQLFSVANNQFLLDSSFSFLTGGGVITWSLSTETLTWASDLKLILPHKGYDFTILANSVSSISDGDVLYIVKDNLGGNKSLIKVTNGNVPNDPSSEPIVLRIGDNIYFRHGALELKGDATDTSGRIDGITEDILTFIGASNESDSDPNYTSDHIVTQGGSLTNAISELDNQVNAILTDTPEEEDFIVGVGGQTIFNASSMSWNALNSIVDILVFVNGKKQKQDVSGGLTQDYRKNSTTQIEFSYTVPENARVTIHSVRTGGGGAGSVITVSGEWKVEYHTITALEFSAKQFTISETPFDNDQVLVDVVSGSTQQNAVDFDITGDVFDWNGLGLDGNINIGDIIRLAYFFVP